MADAGNRNSEERRQPDRLQRRAPSSLQINPVTEWNVAISLLSPLVLSPTSDNSTVETISCSSNNKESATAPVVVMKKWQHPAAPFSYEPAPFTPFVHTGVSDR